MGENVKHTPGPWTVDGPSHNQIVWSSPEDRVCFLAHSNGANPDRDFANGRLIAAAPEMLALLKGLYSELVRQGINFGPYIADAESLIAKVEARP